MTSFKLREGPMPQPMETHCSGHGPPRRGHRERLRLMPGPGAQRDKDRLGKSVVRETDHPIHSSIIPGPRGPSLTAGTPGMAMDRREVAVFDMSTEDACGAPHTRNAHTQWGNVHCAGGKNVYCMDAATTVQAAGASVRTVVTRVTRMDLLTKIQDSSAMDAQPPRPRANASCAKCIYLNVN